MHPKEKSYYSRIFAPKSTFKFKSAFGQLKKACPKKFSVVLF